MAELPSGTVTFLFTDLESSTRLWSEHPEAMRSALARHDAILRSVIAGHSGHYVKTTGDGAHAVFATASAAVDAAIAAQLALQAEDWSLPEPLRARMGIHSGPAELRDGDYFGTSVNRAARLMGVAHAGQIVVSLATVELARDDLDGRFDLIDLGEHRLRDVAHPEHVFQVSHPGLRAEFPALRSLDAFATNLPLQVDEFVGRDSELVEVAEALAASRVVTLTGAGGVGKTRLSVQAAAAALPNFADGVWFVDLAAVDDESFVATEIATTMGLPEYRHGDREEALVGALARRHALVVLDNCEHLVDTVARVVELIVRRCPTVTVLATSQEILGIDGEATIAVRPLRDDEAQRLFVDRAKAARHGFDESVDGESAIAELCRRLDGMPLAIELAAARVASMSPAAILERVDERFRLFGQGRRTARRRHQTLRAAVEWSYGLLEPEEQLVFDRLAAFAGDFTLDAATAIVADDEITELDIVDVIGGLVAKSMVQLVESGAGDRYRLLETLREYGLERLAERGDVDQLQRRHAGYFAGWIAAAAPEVIGPDDGVWRARIEAEYPNLRVALAFTREHEPTTFVRSVDALVRFWTMEVQLREALAWIEVALATMSEEPGVEVADVLATAGVMAFNLGRWEAGFEFVRRSIDRSTGDGEPPRARAMAALSLAALVQNRPDDVIRHSDEAVVLARARGEPFELAEMLATAAIHNSMHRDDTRCAEMADESLDVARALGNQFILSHALAAAGITRYRTDPVRAVELIQASLDVGIDQNFRARSPARFIKALAHMGLRDDATAAVELRDALRDYQELGEEYYQATALAAAAALLRRHGQPELAVRILAMNVRLSDETGIVGAPRHVEGRLRLEHKLEHEIDPDRLASLRAEGRGMTLDDAVAEVLDALTTLAKPQSIPDTGSEADG
jgi:predicted ATPase/class 3 adenylate cyclase